jgi:hypothetical protein
MLSFRDARLLCAGALALLGACAAEAPRPTLHAAELGTGAEVFRMFCMRVAREEFPTDPDGARFVPACEGTGPAPASSHARRLPALLARRQEIVTALDQVFAEADGQTIPGVSGFIEHELEQFLAALIPYYDDGTLPRATRALASVATKLLDASDPRGQKVLDTFARLSARSGYRASGDAFACLRPLLTYPGLDALSQQLLGFVAGGAPAHDTFVELLRAGALELAQPAEPERDVQGSTLRLAAELLLTEDASFADAAAPVRHYVRRDDDGDALLASALDAGVAPFSRRGRPDDAPRDGEGRALVAPGARETLHHYGDANRSLLAALLRDQAAVLARRTPDARSAGEQLLRGLRPLLGAAAARKRAFTLRAAGEQAELKGELAFRGIDVEHGPLLDLVHALTQLLRYPETDRLLALLVELLDQHESAALAPVYAALAIDRRADDHPGAQLLGVDGQPGTPQELWDDVIAIGMRIAERPGLFRALAAALTLSPEGAAQGRLMARFMGFRDEIKYRGPPPNLGGDGRFSQPDADALNAPVTHALTEPVERAPGGDVGMNRSLFQRLLSTIHATNGAPNCNKEASQLQTIDPTTETLLTFPNPTARPTACGGDLLCESAAVTAYGAIDLLCPAPEHASVTGFARCALVEQASGAEFYMRSMIGKALVKLKDEQLACLAESGLAGDLGATQESSSQIEGFTLTPRVEAVTRFIYAPRNAWVSALFEPLPTIDGVPLVEYEPSMLFALEAKDANTSARGAPLSFRDASEPLVSAFDAQQPFDDTPGGQVARGGYLFADLMSTLHLHWASRRSDGCPRSDADPACAALGLSGHACNAGCTQSRDPARPFYSKQSNVVSYEPLLIEAFADEQLGELLALAARTIASIQIACEDGVSRDGLTILGDFVERVLAPDPELAAYASKRRYVKTNTCAGERVEPSSGAGSCGCPAGSQPRDRADAASACVLPDGTAFPRGRVLPQATPLHLVLDALRRFDEAFAEPASRDRLEPWRAARSTLVDLFLGVTRVPDAGAPDDAAQATYSLSNPRSRKLGSALLSFLRGRIAYHRAAGAARGEDLESWADELPDRLADLLAHPLVARATELADQLWNEHAPGGPADELARFLGSVLDPAQQASFADLVLCAADALHVLDRDRALTPAIQFAALLFADNAFEALDSLAATPEPPSAETGSAQCVLELSRKVADLNRGRPHASVLSRLLKNAVLPDSRKQNLAPIEILIDAIADVNRADPSLPSSAPHDADDVRAVFAHLHSFLGDPDRGLERLYSVIGARMVK